MWHFPESGIEPMFLALAGGFLIPESAEKPVFFFLFVFFFFLLVCYYDRHQ